jgi:putative ABC transport system permease protein
MPTDLKMAWRNIWRNPRRSILTMLAIAFACLLLVFMLSWQFGTYETMIDSSVRISTGHLKVQAQGYNQKRSIRKVVADPDRVVDLMKRNAAVKAVARRSIAFALLSSRERTYGIMITGVDPVAEARVSTLGSIVRKGAYLDPADRGQALVGEILARNLKVDVGDELVVLGQGREGSIAATLLTVKGIYRSGLDAFDRSTLNMTLADFQEVFGMRGAVHEVVAVVNRLEQVAAVKAWITARLAQEESESGLVVLDWDELMPGLMQSIQMDLVSGIIFYAILVVVVAFSIFNTFLMTVLERTREFGVMSAIGTTPGRLVRLLLLESAGMTLLGMLLGITIGSLLTLYFQVYGIAIPGAEEMMRQFGLPERIYPRLSFASALIGPLLVMAVTVAAALFPALRVRRLQPVEAMTHI